MKHLDATGYSVASIHGNKSQGQRERALKGFRDGEIKTLIATDVAARGIDIPAVSHVFNYDLPEVPMLTSTASVVLPVPVAKVSRSHSAARTKVVCCATSKS